MILQGKLYGSKCNEIVKSFFCQKANVTIFNICCTFSFASYILEFISSCIEIYFILFLWLLNS